MNTMIWLPEEIPLAYISQKRIFSSVLKADTAYFEINVGNQNPERLVIWLHGSGKSYREMIMLVAPIYVKEMVRRKKEGNSIRIIIPYCLPDLMWMNTSRPVWNIENYLIDELIPMLVKESNIDTDIRHEIHGYSMGGYAALRLGLKYNHMFEKIVAIGAGPLADNFADNVKGDKGFKQEVLRTVYGDNERLYQRSSPYAQALLYQDLIVQRHVKVDIVIGEYDEALSENLKLDTRLKKLGINSELISVRGCSHNLYDYVRMHYL